MPAIAVPTSGELQNVELALTRLWQLDTNRLTAGEHYKINVGTSRESRRLFTYVDDNVFNLPTYKAFKDLLDNYIPQVGIREKVDANELRENALFIKEVMNTLPMLYVHKYLVQKGKVPADRKAFARLLDDVWFEMYRRAGAGGDSSAFEHVFLGEIDHHQAKAFHNWINFYVCEQNGTMKYEGTIHERGEHHSESSGHEHVIKMRFSFKGAPKPFSSSFIGTSPEFEFALYTLLFYLGREDTEFSIEGIRINIKVYDIFRNGERKIGSAFPSILGFNKLNGF